MKAFIKKNLNIITILMVGISKAKYHVRKLTKFVDGVQGIGSKINIHFIKHIQGLFADALELITA